MRLFLSFLFVFVLFFLLVSDVYCEDKVFKQDVVGLETPVVIKILKNNSFDFNNTLDWNPIITLLCFVGSFIFIKYQFKKQQEIEKKNFKNSVYIGFYEKIIANINETNLTILRTNIHTILCILTIHLTILNDKENIDLIKNDHKKTKENIDEIVKELDYESKKSFGKIKKILNTCEDYAIILPNLDIFTKVLRILYHKNLYDYSGIRHIFNPEYRVLLTKNFKDWRGDIEEKITNHKEDWIEENLEKINQVIDKLEDFQKHSVQIQEWIYDIKIELQNQLLGGFFDRKVPLRKYGNLEIILTSTDPKMIKKIQDFISIHEEEKHPTTSPTNTN